MRRHVEAERIVNLISLQRLDVIAGTSCLHSVHEEFRHLTKLLMRGIKHPTKLNVFCQYYRCLWITATITNTIKYQHMLYRKSFKGEIAVEQFRAYQNKHTSAMR